MKIEDFDEDFKFEKKKIDFDEDFEFKKKRSSDILFIVKIISIVFIAFSFLFSFLIMRKIGNSDYEIEEKGYKYGRSQFIKYQGKISVPVPSGGRYFLENVDISSFREVDSGDVSDRSTLVVGMDKNHVYCGNISLTDLNSNKLEVIGNGYYTDGTNTYFCSPFSQRNEKLSVQMELFQHFMYALSKTKKPQSYIYPYIKIKIDKKLKPVEKLQYFATDGEKVYYKGEVLENADLDTLKSVDDYNEYFADKENVYYKSKLLPIKNSGKLKIVSSEQGNEFLYDEINGYVFMETYSFDRKKAPYKVIGNKGGHLNSLVFVNNEGVYYYDTKTKKQKRAGDNIFIGNIEEISPNVFTDDENIYYFHAYSIWSKRKGGGGGLASRNTEIYYLDKKEGWKKITDVGSGVYGSVWQKGDKYYYFDNLGISQLIDNAIYEITDIRILEELRSSQNNTMIKKLIENEKLIKVEGEKKIKIVDKYKGSWNYFMIFFILSIFIIPTIFNACKKIISRRIDNEAGRF